jgi:hypothetical protein
MSADPASAAAQGRSLGGSLVSLWVGLAVLLMGCGGSSDADAPYTVAGLNSASAPAAPGMALVVGVPVAIRTGSVVLESAVLVQLPGYPLPHMVAVGLVPGKGWDVLSWGWPPLNGSIDQAGVGTFPVRPLTGYVLTAGHPIAIYYAFSGDRPGQTYYAAGIQLTYRRGTQEHTVTLYQVGADCVTAGFPKANRECDISSAANDRIGALPH